MIKVHYAATVNIDMCIPDEVYNKKRLLIRSYDELRDCCQNDLTPALKQLIEDELGDDYSTVQVIKHAADVYEVLEEEEA